MRLAAVLKWVGIPVAIVYSIDVDSYRVEIAEELRKATGRELRIDLSISLSPAVVVEKVSRRGSGKDLRESSEARRTRTQPLGAATGKRARQPPTAQPMPRSLNRLLNFATWPPVSTSRCCPPVQAGWVLGSMSSFTVSPALP